jgi:hypothetical protein
MDMDSRGGSADRAGALDKATLELASALREPRAYAMVPGEGEPRGGRQ